MKKTIDITRAHFRGLYNNVNYDAFVYDSNHIEKVRDFATASDIQIMVIIIDAFQKSSNLINRYNDKKFGESLPIDLVRETRPIVIIDEPQSTISTDDQMRAVRSLNPLCTIRYSATPIRVENKLYRLNAVDSFAKKLVKEIEVESFAVKDAYNDAYLLLKSVNNKKTPITARIEMDVQNKKGAVSRKTVTVKQGDDLYEKSGGRDMYEGYIIKDIYCAEGRGAVDFTSRSEILRLGKAIGNPLYHWSHLELRRFFGYNGILNKKTAPEVWKLANEKLQSEGYTSRGLIMMSNVDTICTTDDPVDDLNWHEKLAADKTFPVTVLPAWRPDKAMNLEKDTYLDYLAQLEKAAGMSISSFEDLKKALHIRLDYFAAHNCKLSDHALNYVMYAPASDKEIETIFAARLNGKLPDAREEAIFKYAFMTYVAGEYAERNWVMQLHYGCRRDNNPTTFRQMGPDTGFDCVDNYAPSAQTAAFLGALQDADKLPKTILYSLNTNDNAAIDSILGCFQNDKAVGYIQHGSAWWFNDHFDGMSEQLKSLASLGYLAGFVGMLTDSRSFLSYPRHEYFRRILCRIFGQWVEEGFFPEDIDTLKEIVSDISYGNAKRYFAFPKKEI